MKSIREDIGGLGNMLFKEAYLWGQMREGNIPDIYVQSSEYWKKYQDELRYRFASGIGRDERIALQIRRGDYLKVSHFHTNLWDTDYYRKAVELFPNEKFLVFCKDNQDNAQDQDDKEWCERNIPQLKIDFEMRDHEDEVTDFNLMASCKGIIGANSSFSWWAAFLNPNHDKKIVFPREKSWFVDGKVRTKLMDSWIQI